MECSSFDTRARLAADASRQGGPERALAPALAGLGIASLGVAAAGAKKKKR